METIFLKVKGGRDISFSGNLIGHALDQYSGVSHAVYETEKGHWLYAKTDEQDALLQHVIIENRSPEELVKVLGFSNTAKIIYEHLDIDTTERLDI